MPFLLVMERKRLRVDHYPRKRIKSQHHAFNPLLVRFWSRVCISRLHLPGMARPGEYKGQRINLRDGSEEEAVLMVPTTSGNSRNVHNGDGAICETKKIGSAAAKKKRNIERRLIIAPGSIQRHWAGLLERLISLYRGFLPRPVGGKVCEFNSPWAVERYRGKEITEATLRITKYSIRSKIAKSLTGANWYASQFSIFLISVWINYLVTNMLRFTLVLPL